MKRLLVMGIAAAAAWGAVPGPAAAGETSWATGAALQRRLAAPLDIVWSGNPLRQALRGLARAQHFAILVDRRVDPEQRLEIKLSGVPLAGVLREIARSRQLGVALLGSVVYFGPPEAAARLRTLSALRQKEARQLGQAAARGLLAAKPFAWDDFATPGELLGRLAEEGGVKIDGFSRVPHDLWAAADLAPLPWVDRLTLLAIQFDLTFEIAPGGRRVELVPLPDDLPLSVGDGLGAKGGPADDSNLHSAAQPQRPSPAKPAPGRVVINRFAVQDRPVGKVLEQLSARLGFELQVDTEALRAAGISLDQRVSVQLDNVTLDEALRQLLRNTPLAFHHRGNVVRILPK